MVLNTLLNEAILRTESSIAICEEYNNADMKFKYLNEQLDVNAIISNESGFELSLEQKESPFLCFNFFLKTMSIKVFP